MIVYCLRIDIADLPMQQNDDYIWLPTKETVERGKIYGYSKKAAYY